MDENLKNLIIATPVIGVLLYFLNYFIKGYEKEKKTNDDAAKQDSKVIEGLRMHVEESNKKQDDTNKKLDHVIRKLDK